MIKPEFTSALISQISSLENIANSIELEIAIRKQLPEPVLFESVDLCIPPGSSSPNQTYDIKENIELAMNKRIISELESNLEAKKAWLKDLKERVPVEAEDLENSFSRLEKECVSVIKKGSEIKDLHDKARFDYAVVEFNLWISKGSDNQDKKEACVYYYKLIVETLKLSGVPVLSIAV